MKIIEIATKHTYEIEATKSGENYLKCPVCSDDRKNKRAKSFSWNNQKLTGTCHHCQSKFVLMNEDFKVKQFKQPEPIPETKAYSAKLAAWFMNRGLFESTMKRFNIAEGEHFFPQIGIKRNAILFPYYRDKKLVNVKYRDAEKNFTLSAGAELIPFNLDSIKDSTTIIITEGEFDCMAIDQAGFKPVISVPNGASTGNNNLSWLDGCIDYFDKAEKIILATDKDNPGVNLRTQLSARLGVERCFKVEFGDCKDSNDVLIKYGADKLKQIINAAESFPIEGAYTVIDIEDELNSLYMNGLKRGYTTGIADFDKLISFEFGRLYTITGIPSHGKSKFVDWLTTRLNLKYQMKVAYFSPETFPIQIHTAAITELLTGKKFGFETLNENDYYKAKVHLNDQFYWIMPEDDFTVENILSKARQLVLRKGVQMLVIDPYNKLEHQIEKGENETQYISRFLDQIVNFAHKNNIIVFLVAHPKKMPKQANGTYELPTLYDINGSANFFNKTDFGMTVYRDFDQNTVTTVVNKVKFKHLGETGQCSWKYNIENNRFTPFVPPAGSIIYDNINWLNEGFLESHKFESGLMPISNQFRTEKTPF